MSFSRAEELLGRLGPGARLQQGNQRPDRPLAARTGSPVYSVSPVSAVPLASPASSALASVPVITTTEGYGVFLTTPPIAERVQKTVLLPTPATPGVVDGRGPGSEGQGSEG